MGKMTKEPEKDGGAKKNNPRGKYLARLEGNKLKEPPASFKTKVFAELGLDRDGNGKTTQYNRRAGDKTDYTKLTKIMKHNQPLLAHISSHTGFKKEDIVGAAILHFSSLPLSEQLELVTRYHKIS